LLMAGHSDCVECPEQAQRAEGPNPFRQGDANTIRRGVAVIP
jgi:hypothetical protein